MCKLLFHIGLFLLYMHFLFSISFILENSFVINSSFPQYHCVHLHTLLAAFRCGDYMAIWKFCFGERLSSILVISPNLFNLRTFNPDNKRRFKNTSTNLRNGFLIPKEGKKAHTHMFANDDQLHGLYIRPTKILWISKCEIN